MNLTVNRFILLLPILIFAAIVPINAQTIYGLIKDAKSGAPISGASIQVKEINLNLKSDDLGEFNIPNNGTYPLTVTASYIGFADEVMILNSNEPFTLLMKEKALELNEVLVVSGYNNQRKSEFSGTVASITPKQLSLRPSAGFDGMLGGQAPGVDVLQPTGVLNNTPMMRVRGINSITSGLFPLVIVDGVTVFVGSIGGLIGNNPLSDINPNDIASIDILKDASAAAIYGSRAANGVMVITTKKGKKGVVKVNYNATLTRSTPYNLPELLNAEDYTMIKNEAMTNSGRAPGYALSYNEDGSVVNTSWYDVAYRPGISHNHNISVAGANNSTNYYFSIGYNDQNNFIKYNTFKRYSTRLNMDNQINSHLKLGINMAYSNGLNVGPNTGAIASNSLSSSSYNSNYITNEPLGRMTYVLPPNVPVYKKDGSYSIQNGVSVGYGANSTSVGTINAYNLAMVQKLDVNTSENNTVIGNVFGELKLLKDLTLKTSYGLNNLLNENTAFMNPVHGGGASSNGVSTNTTTKYYRTDWVNTLIYNFSINDNNHFSALLGHEQIKTTIDAWGATRSNITDPNYENYQGGFINIAPAGNVFTENALLSYFSNLNYDYGRKYLLSAYFRRDGLSALAKGNRFGNFGGGSIGWNISKENFFKGFGIQKYFDNLKIRASYGVVGNSEIGDFPTIGAYTSNTYGGLPTLVYAQTSNPDLKWETSKKFDAGLNFTLFNERVNVEFDYYKNLIDGLIMKAPQALSAGIPGNYINANVGSMYNQGIELGIGGNVIEKGKFKWDVNLNFSTLENKVTALVSDVYVPSIFGVQNMTRVGYSIGSVFAVPCLGVNPDNGLMMFVNKDGKTVQYNHIGSPKWTYLDGTAAPAIDNYNDGVIQGPSLPKYFGGFNNAFAYKNFSLNVNLTFVGGNLLYNGTRATLSDQRYFNNGQWIKDRWTTPGQKTEIQKLQYGDNVSAGFSFSATSKVEKGDYLKVKNISLGYSIPIEKTFLRDKISSTKIFIQAENLYTFTKYRGSDPEVSINGNSIHSGKDQNIPPNAQVFGLGLNVGF